MLSSMFSPCKKTDKELLYEIGEMAKALISFDEELAKKFVVDYQTLQQKIQTYDYSKDDEVLLRSMDRQNELLC